MKTILILLFLVLINPLGHSQNSQEDGNNVPVDTIIADLKKFIPEYLKNQNVPGASIVLVNEN